MSDTKLSIYESINRYTEKLTYLAQENKRMANDLMLLIVVDQVYDWSSWMEATQQHQMDLQNFKKNIIRNNPDLVNYRTPTNLYYKNVSTPQTMWTWQRVYDNFDVITFETLPT